MTTKIAIMSDVHGNAEAMYATLRDAKKRGVTKFLCLGDLVGKGIHSKECIQMADENFEVVTQGNWDSYVTSTEFSGLSEMEIKKIKYAQRLMGKEELEYLRNLPFCYEFLLSGCLVRLFHATPVANNVNMYSVSSFEDKYKMFLPSDKTISNQKADIVVFGHTHQQFMDKLYNRTLINAGSVGNNLNLFQNDKRDSSSKVTTKAHYVILEGAYGDKSHDNDISFQFPTVSYDIEKELEDLEYNPQKVEYEQEIRYGKYNDKKSYIKYLKNLGLIQVKYKTVSRRINNKQ